VCSEYFFTRRDLFFRIETYERKRDYELSSPALENNCEGMKVDPLTISLTEKYKVSGTITRNL
jgi:hypothetical protein